MIKKRRIVIGIVVSVGLVVAGWAAWVRTTRPTTNVLFITLDTTRADRLGCYGYPEAQTPTLDRLASEGVLFERACSPAPLTLPVHASLFTGLYPAEHGLRTNGRGSLDRSIPTLATDLAAAGYDTAAFVASFVLNRKFGLNRGFAVYDDDLSSADPAEDALHRQRDGSQVVDRALAWLKQPRNKPFLCWVHLYDPHFPYLLHEAEFGDRFAGRPYDAEIAYVDQQVQRLLTELDQQGATNQTLVVVVGDHGEGLGQHVEKTHGYTLYEATQHVPLMMRLPGQTVPGHRATAPVPLVDVHPTLVELLNIKSRGKANGRSLAGAVKGQAIDGRKCLASTDDPFLQNGWSPLASLVQGDWKYIRTTKPELFDLSNDPGEIHNLVATEPAKLAQMQQSLDQFQQALVATQAAAVQLSPAERRALASLGYLGGGTKAADAETAGPLPDVKDMLPFDVAAQEAVDRLHAGQIQPAIEQLRRIVADSTTHVASRLFLGEALQHEQQFDAAIACYEEILRLKPDHLGALIHLGLARLTQDRLDDALARFDEALAVDPDSGEAHYNRGLVLVQLGRLDEAID